MTGMCPHCGEIVTLKDGLTPYHDWPKPFRQVCPGSKKISRSPESDHRLLWSGKPNPHITTRDYSPSICSVFWGSHGCDKPVNHETYDPVHQCGTDTEDEDDPDYNGGPCTQMIVTGAENDNSDTALVRYSLGTPGDDHEGWGEWATSRWFT